MKITLLAVLVSALALTAYAEDLTRGSGFDSVESFVAAVKVFRPAAAKTDLSALFTARELGQPGTPEAGAVVTASSIQSSTALWAGESRALVFVTAAPPTEATRSAVGVLFLLTRAQDRWRIADHLRFTAIGKYAALSAELTADTGTGYRLGSEGMMPVVTVKESQGGRGYTYELSASYTFEETKLKRMELE
ncbi:hypothetical protein ACXR0O_13465 [Verrucomicrobiota bacterium sgz303538]